jgi:aldose 1-epimerase
LNPPPASGEQIEIAHGDQRAVVVEVGGGLRAYSAAGRELVDGYAEHEICSSGRGQLLVPWPNRIEDGRYDFDGRSHQTPLTEPGRRNAIHGLVRWLSWTIAEREPGRVVMEHRLNPQPGYPFTLDLRVQYGLDEGGLAVRLTATNSGVAACPYGCGAHPYLTLGTPAVDPLLLHLPARTVLQSDERGLPTGRMPVAGTAHDFRTPRAVAATVLDHAFTDLERGDDGRVRVELRDPESGAGVALWADAAFPYLMAFTGDPLADVNRRSLAVEPMTCPPNALRTGEAVVRLEPGSSFAAAWGIERLEP